MDLYGTVSAVTARTLGDSLTTAATAGDSTVTVYDAGDFVELGGTLRVGGDDPAAQIVDYTAADPDTNLITLAATLTGSWPVDTPVELWDPDAGGVYVDYRALVALPGDIGNSDVLDTSISHSLIPYLPAGIRDPGTGESVTITSPDGGTWTVTNVLGRTPSSDGGFITPGTVGPLQMTFGPVTIGNTPPTDPHLDDIWFDGTNGYQMNQWNGTTWVPATFGTNALSAGSVTTAILAANAVVAANIATGALDAQTINAGTLNAGIVSTGVMGASQILSSDLANCDIAIDPDGGTILIYALSGQTTVNLTTAGANTWTVPAGITKLDRVETWGATGGSQGCAAGGFGGCGSGGGEYAREDNLTVTPLANIPYTIGAGGTAGASTGAAAGNGGDTNWNSGQIIAHGSIGGGTFGSGISVPGGTGSTNSVHFPGGRGHAAGGTFGTAGGGGGSSAGPTRAGNDGGAPTAPATGGPGGTAVPDGGAGGAGRNGGGTGLAGTSGTAPGGGAGGAGSGTAAHPGAAGSDGKIRIKYAGARVLVASIAGVSGTDQYGNSYPAGIRTNTATAAGLSGGYYEEKSISGTALSNATTLTFKPTTTVKLISDYGSAFNTSTGAWTCPADGVYDIVAWSQPTNTANLATASSRSVLTFSSSALAAGTIYQEDVRTVASGARWSVLQTMTRFLTSGTVVFTSLNHNGVSGGVNIDERLTFVRRG